MRKADTVSMLVEWGKWSRGGYANLRAKSPMSVCMALVEPAGCRVHIDISDDDAMRVNRAVGELGKHNGEAREVIILYFVRGLGTRELGLQMKMSRDKAAKILAHAMGWIDCRLNISQAA